MSLADIRYVEALADISFQDGTVDSYKSILTTISKAFQLQEDFRWFLLTPEVKQDIKKETLIKLFGNEMDNKLINFLMLLIQKSRISNLPGILNEFNKLADLRKNELCISIVSAAPLDDSQINRIKDKYRAEYKADSVHSEVKIDPSIMGGLIIKIGDKLIDSSVKGRLKALNSFIIDNP